MSRYRKTMSEAYKNVYEQEKDHEISMARGELEAIADKATQLSSALQGKSDDGNPLSAWVQSKITKAKDYINTVSDYLMYNPEQANEEVIGEATSHTVRFTDPLNKKKFAIPFKTHAAAEKKMAQLKKDGVKEIKITMDELKPGIKFAEGVVLEKVADSIIKTIQKAYAPLKGKTISPQMATKISKHLDQPTYDLNTLRQLYKANIPFISTLARNKIYKKTGKFESLDEALDDYGLKGKITDAQLKNIKDVWAKKTKMHVTPGVKAMIARMDIPTKLAIQHAKINVLSDLVKEDNIIEGKIKDIFTANQEGESIDKIAKRLNMSVNDVKKILGEDTLDEANIDADNIDKEKDSSKEKELKIKLDKEKDTDALEKQLIAAQGQINILKQKLENEKHKVVKPEPNPETGEIPLTVGIAHKILKDKREKEMKKEDVEHPAKAVYEQIAGLKKKADKSGMPYSILKKVYDRGMAAWRGGHRPGTSQQQWAFARVNSFVTKSSGTWGGADKDLAAKVKGSK